LSNNHPGQAIKKNEKEITVGDIRFNVKKTSPTKRGKKPPASAREISLYRETPWVILYDTINPS
jgi:hypothetical protein